MKTDVIIIGGGATGCGIARDLALRGITPLSAGGRGFRPGGDRGLPWAAPQRGALRRHGCRSGPGMHRREQKRCAASVRNASSRPGACFVRLPGDSKRFRDKFLKSCEAVGIPTQVLSSTRALELVPALNPTLEESHPGAGLLHRSLPPVHAQCRIVAAARRDYSHPS